MQPIMNENPCPHGNYACPLCDVPATFICPGCVLPENHCCCGTLQGDPMLTETEAETLAVLLDSASKKMASVRTVCGTYAWPEPYEATADMFRGFYDIAPYGIFI